MNPGHTCPVQEAHGEQISALLFPPSAGYPGAVNRLIAQLYLAALLGLLDT
jgi:hypothetical protein